MDLSVIKSCLNNDRLAQKQLYECFKVRMFVLTQRYFADIEEAKDALQDGFIKVFKELHQYDASRGNLSSWVSKIFINCCLEKIRKRRISFQDLSEQELEIATHCTTEENLTLQDLTKMIQQLPIGYRTIFNMYVIEGYSHAEIGTLLNISENTSKTQLMKAKKALKIKLESVLNK